MKASGIPVTKSDAKAVESLADELEKGKTRDSRSERRRRYRVGFVAEFAAAACLMATGHRILARRSRTPFGEIDLIARRGGRVSFVEVKARRTLQAAEASVSPRQRERVKRAAGFWLSRHSAYQDFDVTYDIVFVLPWRWPRHLVNAL